MRLTGLLLFVCAAAFAAPTFHKDVEPILQNSCQECHRAGEIGPMQLLTYEQARPWAKAIKAAVLQNKMPPWPADPHYGKFSNDRSLSKADIDTIAAWADAGAPEGNKADAPKARHWVDGWNISKPDAIVEMPQAFNMPASGEVDYQYIVVPTGFTEDKWIQQVEIRPSGRTVVHHAVIFIREPGSKWLTEAQPGVPFVPTVANAGARFLNTQGQGNDVLGVYTPGMVPDIWKPGQAKQIKAGSDLIFQMHYTASGKPGSDRTRVGLVFSKEPPKERIVTIAAINNRFTIPAGDGNFKAEATAPIQNDMTIRASDLPPLRHRADGSISANFIHLCTLFSSLDEAINAKSREAIAVAQRQLNQRFLAATGRTTKSSARTSF